MGFLVKLDSNGSHPQVLKLLLQKKLVDYIAMDVKASPTKYSEICDTSIDFELIDQSRDLIMNSGIDHEFRTTLLSPFHDLSEVEAIAHFCKGAQKYTIQNFRPQKVLNPSFSRYQGLDKSTLIKMEAIASKFIDQVVVLD